MEKAHYSLSRLLLATGAAFLSLTTHGALHAASNAAESPATWARFVPERSDDFAWENDLVAFRTYGPALRAGAEDSGIDVWLKRVSYPIIDKWYAGHLKGVSYHKDHGEGYDPYHVGSSRGCGGTALWRDNRMVTSDTFVAWRVIERRRERSVFELDYVYPAEVDETPITETKRITIDLGEPFFLAESRFHRDGEPVVDLPVAIGVTTQNGRAKATLRPENRWVAVWDKIEGFQLGTGAVIAPGYPVEAREIKSAQKDESHAVIITRTDENGRVVYHAGYGWEKAGHIRSEEDWFAVLAARSAR